MFCLCLSLLQGSRSYSKTRLDRSLPQGTTDTAGELE